MGNYYKLLFDVKYYRNLRILLNSGFVVKELRNSFGHILHSFFALVEYYLVILPYLDSELKDNYFRNELIVLNNI